MVILHAKCLRELLVQLRLKTLEQVMAIMRPDAASGWYCTANALAAMPHPSDRIIVQIAMRHLKAIGKRAIIDCEAMVLSRNLHFARR